MSFSASLKNINEILSRNTVFSIPKNQRKYVWSENQWNELFEDVFLIDQTSTYKHFLGSFVFANEDKDNQYSIIDGQQRLTTICLLIAAISNLLFRIGESKAAKSNISNYLKGNNDGEEYYRVERKDGPFFLVSLIDSLSSFRDDAEIKKLFSESFVNSDKYNEKLLLCYLFFFYKIQGELEKTESKKEYLIELKNKIVNCEVIEIIVEKDVDGYRVFETLNARGIPLEQHELIKNYLYSYLRNKSQRQRLDNLWQRIIENVTSNGTDHFSSFISHYCTHVFGKVAKNGEFKTIRSNTLKSNVGDLLTSLFKNSVYYSFFLNPDSLRGTSFFNEEILLALVFFKNLNIRQVRPVLLSLFEKYDEKCIDLEELKKCIVATETFYFLYSTVLKNTTNLIDSTIISLSKKIHFSNDDSFFKDIFGDLSKFVSETDKIKDAFRFLGFSNKNKKYKNSSNRRTISYVFSKFERYFDAHGETIPRIGSIEHIAADSDINDFRSYIGNLLPLSAKLNNKVSNRPLEEKIEKYKTSKFFLVTEFLKNHGEKNVWSDADIKTRGEALSNIAIDKIWFFREEKK